MRGAITHHDAGRDAAGSGRDRSRRGPLAFVVGALACGLAAFLLHRALSRYDAGQIRAAIAGFPMARLLGAAGFAAASYLCLTAFDYLALIYARRPLAYRRAALASFTSLSLGHNIGFAALSSGAVRYRFYSRWGLSIGEVAQAILFCGATVGLGLLGLGGAVALLRANEVGELIAIEPATARLAGLFALGLCAGYVAVAFAKPEPLKVRNWILSPPAPRLAIAQLVVGPLNFACVAACLHQALLASQSIAYLDVAAVYVGANAAALASHAPGGLGVIESVVIHFLPGADVLAALLVFRFVYFLVPLALGATLFLACERLLKPRHAAS